MLSSICFFSSLSQAQSMQRLLRCSSLSMTEDLYWSVLWQAAPTRRLRFHVTACFDCLNLCLYWPLDSFFATFYAVFFISVFVLAP